MQRMAEEDNSSLNNRPSRFANPKNACSQQEELYKRGASGEGDCLRSRARSKPESRGRRGTLGNGREGRTAGITSKYKSEFWPTSSRIENSLNSMLILSRQLAEMWKPLSRNKSSSLKPSILPVTTSCL